MNRSKEDLKRDILVSLGHPQIRVDLTDDHLENAIDAAIQQNQKWNVEWSYETTYLYTLSKQDIRNGYIICPEWIETVTEVLPRGWGWSQLNFMNPSWQMAREVFMSYNQFVPLSLVDYTSVMQRLQNVSTILGTDVMPFSWVKLQHRLFFYFPVDENQVIAMKVNEVIDPRREDAAAVDMSYAWDNDQLRTLAIGYAKQAWGRMLSKYKGIALPGGITIDGDALLKEGSQEIDDAIHFMKNAEPFGQFFLG